MGFFDDVFENNPYFAPYYALNDKLDLTGDKAKESLAEQQAKMGGARAGAKQQQLAMLAELKGPTTTPQQEARIKALETESTRPMLEDPNYGFQVGQATRGGAQALSSIQNRQRASGATGGFQNVGSMSDVYDRVGGQLSAIAVQNQQLKEQKRDQAAMIRQNIADGEIAFQNSIKQAQMAIEAGDAAATQSAMQAAYNAKQQIDNATKQMIFSTVGTIGGAMVGGPMGAAAGNQAGTAMAGRPVQDTSAVYGGGTAGGWQGQSVGGGMLQDMNAGPQIRAGDRPFVYTGMRGR